MSEIPEFSIQSQPGEEREDLEDSVEVLTPEQKTRKYEISCARIDKAVAEGRLKPETGTLWKKIERLVYLEGKTYESARQSIRDNSEDQADSDDRGSKSLMIPPIEPKVHNEAGPFLPTELEQ